MWWHDTKVFGPGAKRQKQEESYTKPIITPEDNDNDDIVS